MKRSELKQMAWIKKSIHVGDYKIDAYVSHLNPGVIDMCIADMAMATTGHGLAFALSFRTEEGFNLADFISEMSELSKCIELKHNYGG